MPVYTANEVFNGTMAAGVDLSDHQYKVVVLSDSKDDTVVKPTGQGVRAFGVLKNDPPPGSQANVCVWGITIVPAGTAIPRNTPVTPRADGTIEPATSGDYVLGIATQAIASGALGSVFIERGTAPLP